MYVREILHKLTKKGNFWSVASRVRLYLLLLVKARETGRMKWARFFEGMIQLKYGVFISHKATFPSSLKLKHPVGIVIGDGVVIGEKVTIYQNVTLGGARVGDQERNLYPTIGDNTVIFAGAVIVGRVQVGENCIIGANAVVLEDVPSDSTAVGVPARIIHNTNQIRE